MGEIITRTCDCWELCVHCNFTSLIQKVQVPIPRVITPTQGLPNPIRKVVSLISYIRSYHAHGSWLNPPPLSFSSTTLTSFENTMLSYPTQCLHLMIMSWHRVQYTPSTQHCLSSLYSHDYELTTECSFNLWCCSLYNRPPSASFPWELKRSVTLSHSHSCQLTNWWIYLWAHSIVIFSCTLKCSQPPPAASSDIPCVDG
jgi:hypothetical protein